MSSIQMPLCIHVETIENGKLSIEFPIQATGEIVHTTVDNFNELVPKIVELSKEYNVKLANYKLVVNLDEE